MANNRLILRTVKSPWITPIPDITKDSVLTHIELDNNLIYLRGEVIHDASVDDGIVTLHKINGNDISYDNDQNNLIEAKIYELTITASTIDEVVNNDPSGLIIDDKTNYFIRARQGTFDLIYGFASGKGNWGASLPGGTPVNPSDFILLNASTGTTTFSPWKVGSGLFSIEAINDSGLLATGNYAVAEGRNTLASGEASHAEGIDTTASGDYSHAEGAQTTASGMYSHAEGDNTQALGSSSHAEGDNTIASGNTSHAEGRSTTASGSYSHAEGQDTIASGFRSHAEGRLTLATGNSAHAEGHITESTGLGSHAEGGGEGDPTIASGNFSHAEGNETLASGIASHSQGRLTEASGNYSHAEGFNTIASAQSSHAEGDATVASGNTSHAEGFQSIAGGDISHAEGLNTTASGDYSHSEGFNTTASGDVSHAQGQDTIASGHMSHAGGVDNEAFSYGETAIGLYSTTYSPNSTGNFNELDRIFNIGVGESVKERRDGLTIYKGGQIVAPELTISKIDAGDDKGLVTKEWVTANAGSGGDTYWVSGSTGNFSIKTINDSGLDATGNYATASGYYTFASGVGSHAEGFGDGKLGAVISSGEGSHAEGRSTTASGLGSHSEGLSTEASGSASHAEGNNTTASGDYSHAEGDGTTASGSYSHAEGYLTTASSYGSHAEGLSTTASGYFSHAEGNNTTASGYASHAEGEGTIASGDASHAGGTTYGTGTLVASGDSSFIHYGLRVNDVRGAYADDSAILGGIDHNIDSNANNSIILGGDGHNVNPSVINSAVIGGTGITATQSNTVYLPQLNITDIQEEFTGNTSLTIDAQGNVKKYNQNVLFRGTWAELEALRAASGLTTGRKFILTDYVHKYQINGSNSSDIAQLHTMIGDAGNYTQFNNVPANVAPNGGTAEIVSVPVGATVSVGQIVTIVDYFNSQFIRFSPTVTGAANFGTVFKFGLQRYSNISGDTTILDTNGKPVIKPNGVINTDVHDGMPYMDMTGAENPSPIMEEIVLTALDESTFSTRAESLTFVGDQLEYLFDSTTIDDEDGNLITGVTRNGFIIRRMNEDLDIDVDKDWRNQRYRRYKVDEDNWTNLLLRGDNASLYTYNSKNYSSSATATLDEGHKYIMKEPVEVDFYLDFYSSGNTDIFLSGETGTPSTQAGDRLFDLTPPYMRDVTLPVSGLTSAVDLHIFPVENYEPTSLVMSFNVNSLDNSVFRDLNQVYGASSDFFINSTGLISDSSVNTGCNWNTGGDLLKIIAIDAINISGDGRIDGLFNSNFSNLKNQGDLTNVRIGAYRNLGENNFMDLSIDSSSSIYTTILGVSRADGIKFNNLICVRGLIQGDVFRQSKFTGSMYCTNINSTGTMISLHTDIHNFNKKVLNKPLFGTKHIIPSTLNNISIDDNNAKSDLVTRTTDENYITTITQIGTTN